MNLAHLRSLSEWGFNVPRFIESPGKQFKKDAIHALKELFLRSESVCLLAEREDGVVCREDPGLSIPDAYLRSQSLESSFYTTAIAETIAYDMRGVVVFERGGIGTVRWGLCVGPYTGEYKFTFPEQVPDLVTRHIVRECVRVRERVLKENEGEFVRVDWAWAKFFVGVNDSRLIIFNYRIS